MLKKLKEQEFSWLDISNPAEEDINYLKQHFHFHQLILDELLQPSFRTKVEHLEDHLYLVYHTPSYRAEKQTAEPQEIDFLITKNTLITVHYEPIKILNKLLATCETNPAAKNHYLGKGPGALLYQILERSFDREVRQVNHVGERIKQIEEKMFSGQEKAMIREISIVKRDLLNLQMICRPHQKILDSLFRTGEKFFGKRFRIYFSDLQGDFLEIEHALENLKEILESFEKTNTTLVNTSINDVMRLFSILAFITFPLMLFTSIFSMNTIATPILGTSYDFWIIIAIMLSVSTTMLLLFRKKKLL